MDAQHTKHVTYKLAYHFVWCPKYRKKILEGSLVQWGTITLHLDNEAFRRGFLSARQWYFVDIYGEDGRAPQEPQHATALTSEEVLRLEVMPDEQGRYHFDEMGYENLPEYLGYLVGYLSGPLAPEEAEHYRKSLAQQEYLRRSVPA